MNRSMICCAFMIGYTFNVKGEVKFWEVDKDKAKTAQFARLLNRHRTSRRVFLIGGGDVESLDMCGDDWALR